MTIPALRPSARLVARLSLLPAMVALLAVSLTGAKVPAGTPEDAGLSTERLTRIDLVIQRAIDAK